MLRCLNLKLRRPRGRPWPSKVNPDGRVAVGTASSLPLLVAVWLALGGTPAPAQAAGNWPQFRGPNGSGVAPDADPPVDFSATNGVRWRVAVPRSPSSPCVWRQAIFLTTCLADQLETRCYDARDGRLRWSRAIRPERLEGFNPELGSPAASTPATDGRHVVSYFGSFGLVCYDLAGAERWRHPLPVAVSGGNYGTGTSPILAHDLVLLDRAQDRNSSLLAVEVDTGQTRWEAPRPEATGSFGTPVLWRSAGVEEVVLPGSARLEAYAVRTGQPRWQLAGVTGFACTSPVVGDGLLFFAGWSPGKADAPWPSWQTFLEQHDKNKDGEVTFDELEAGSRHFMSGLDVDHDGKITKADWDRILARAAASENNLIAIRPGGHGDISHTHVAWKATRGLPYVPSPLFYQGRLYLLRDGGMLSSFDAKTGRAEYSQERLGALGSYYASPVAAAGRIYVASLDGRLTVVRAGGAQPEVLHQTDFGERILATPALVGTQLYVRTDAHLYAFGPRAE